jgi:hypothetical protein
MDLYSSTCRGRPSALNNNKKRDDAHGEDDDADGPAVDELVVSSIWFTLIDDFGSEVTWGTTHGLKQHITSISAMWGGGGLSAGKRGRTLSIVRLSTTLARPKSATLTFGGSSRVKRTF